VLCRSASLALPQVAHALAILRAAEFRADVDTLPGYDAAHCGEVHPLDDVLARVGSGLQA